MASSDRLKGKVAIVTGGGSGFGAAITQKFCSHGARVLLGDINEDGMKKTVSSINNASDVTICKKFNATSEDDWKDAVKTVVDKWGKVDIVINNAGTSYPNKPTEKVTEAEFDKCFTLNVKSIYLSVQTVVPQMQKQGHGGAFLSISSIGSTRPRPGLVWYNATKAAVNNASRALAAEYGGDQIRFNCLCPLLSGTGLFETFVGVPYTEENVKQFIGAVPLGRLTDVQDVSNAAAFLCSDEASFLTGVNLDVDGGKGI